MAIARDDNYILASYFLSHMHKDKFRIFFLKYKKSKLLSISFVSAIAMRIG